MRKTTRTVTIANGAATSESVYVRDGELVGIETDSAWDTQNITFTHCSTPDGTYVPVYDSSNAIVTITSATASRYYSLASYGIKGFQYIKVVSAANQTGDTILTLTVNQERY